MIRVVIKKFSPVALVVAILFSNVPVAHAADPLSATRSPSAAANFGLAIAAQNTDPDAAHNAHVDGATVTVYYYEADTTPPSIAAAPDLPGNEATSSAGVAVSFDLPSASDEAGIASESCDPASGLTFALGTTTVTCTAADAVDGTVAVAVGGAVDTSTAGTYMLTYDATDAAGNRAIQQTRIVTVFPVAEVAASPAPSGGNGAPVGLYGTINTVVPVGNAEQTAGNVGIGAGGEVLGAEAYRFTDAQVNALLEFLRAFGVDTALVDALGNVLCSPQGDALRSISTLSLDTVTDTTATLTATSTTP